jgi:hypothetical protein
MFLSVLFHGQENDIKAFYRTCFQIFVRSRPNEFTLKVDTFFYTHLNTMMVLFLLLILPRKALHSAFQFPFHETLVHYAVHTAFQYPKMKL